MKNVTALFKASCNSDVVQSLFKIFVYNKLGGSLYATLEGDDFFENSLTITSQATSSSSFNIGGVCAGKLTVTLTRAGVSKLKNASALRKGMCWKVVQWNKVADSSQSTKDFSKNTDGTENTSGKCNLGVFYVSAVENNDYSCGITAYDGMLAFDKTVTSANNQYMQQNKKTVAGWVEWICGICVTGNYSFEHGVASGLPNSGMSFALSDDKTVSTYRDALGYLSIISGGFCTFDENGAFLIKDYSYTPVSLGMSHKRLITGKFDDKVSEITAVYSSVAGFDFERSSTGSSDKNSVEISISENPFIRGLQPYDKTEMDSSVLTSLNNLADAIIMKEFYGCDCTLSAYPFIDIGDCLSIDRVVVSEDGSATDIVETSIVVSEITYSAGSSIEIKSNSTSGSSTSISSGSRTSQPKVSSAATDNRVDDLIEGMAKYKYTTKTIKVPLTYENRIGGSQTAELGTPIKQTGFSIGVNYNSATESYVTTKNIQTEELNISIPDNAFHTSLPKDSMSDIGGGVGKSYSEGLKFFSIPVNLNSYISDAESKVSNIRVYADFSKAKRMCFLTMYHPMLGGDWSNPQAGCNSSGNLNIEYTTPFVFNDYAYRPIKSMMKFRVSGSFTVIRAEDDSTSLRGTVSGKQQAPGIKPDFQYSNNYGDMESFMYAGDTAIAPIFDMRFNTLAEMRKAISATGFSFAYAPSEYYLGKKGLITVSAYDYSDGNGEPDSTETSVELFNYRPELLSVFGYADAFPTHADFIEPWKDSDGKITGYYVNLHGYYTNLPENILLTYTVKEEVPDDINSVIDSINDNEKGIEELRAEVAELKELSVLTGYNVQNNTEDIAALQKAVDALDPSGDISAEIANLQSQIDEINKKLDEGGSTTELENRVSALETDVSGLKTTTGSLQSSVTALTSDVSTLKSNVEALQTDNTSIHSDITSINTKLDGIGTTEEMQTQINELQSDVASINTRLDNIGSTEEMAQQIADLSTRMTTAEGNISTLQSDMTTAKSAITSLGKRVSDNEYSISNITVTIEAIQKTLADHEKRITALEQGGGGGDELAISEIWLEDKNGNKISSAFCKDDVWYWENDSDATLYLGISVTGASSETTNQFYVQYEGGSWETFGSTTTELKSPSSFYAPSEGTIRKYKASATLGSDTVESSELKLSGFPVMQTSLSESGDYPTKTFTLTASQGAPTVGVSEYKYKFGYAKSESAEPTILQDWGSVNSITVTAGSAEVGGLSEVYVSAYATDGARTTRKVGYTKTVAQTLAITDNWFQVVKTGERLPELLKKDGVWYYPYNGDNKYLYIGATASVSGASKSFYEKYHEKSDSQYTTVGEETTGDLSTVSINADSGGYDSRYDYKTQVTDGNDTVMNVMQLAGYSSLYGSLKQKRQSGSTYTYKASSDSGLPSVGISKYQYRFRWEDYNTETVYVLQDYSSVNTISFELGSATIGGSKEGYLRLDIKDGYETAENTARAYIHT